MNAICRKCKNRRMNTTRKVTREQSHQRQLRQAVTRVLKAVDKAVVAGDEARRARDQFIRLLSAKTPEERRR